MTRGAGLRPARPADLPAILHLETTVFADPWSAASLEDELDRAASIALVATARGVILGYVVARRGIGEGEILRVAVHGDYRREGLGSRLLRAAAEALHRGGAGRLFLEVRADNPGAIALYEACDLEVVGRRDHYYADGADALVFSASLPLRKPPGRAADR